MFTDWTYVAIVGLVVAAFLIGIVLFEAGGAVDATTVLP